MHELNSAAFSTSLSHSVVRSMTAAGIFYIALNVGEISTFNRFIYNLNIIPHLQELIYSDFNTFCLWIWNVHNILGITKGLITIIHVFIISDLDILLNDRLCWLYKQKLHNLLRCTSTTSFVKYQHHTQN